MTSFEQQAHAYTLYRKAVIHHYQILAMDAMVEPLYIPSLDVEIEQLTHELAEELDCTYGNAFAYLQPVCVAIYRAATDAAKQAIREVR